MAEPRWITIKVNAPRFDPADEEARQAGLDVVHPQIIDALAQRRLQLAPGEDYRVRLRDAPHLPAGQVEVTATCRAVPLEEPADE